MPDKTKILIPPPQEGWSQMWFIDGYTADIVGGTTEIKKGKEYSKLILRPTDDLKKRYNIRPEKLINGLYIEMEYPKDMIHNLNEDDPARKVRLCMLNFNGKKTHATEWLEGYWQNKKLERLRDKMEELRIHNAALREENILLKRSIPKYIKTHFSEIMDDIMPLIEKKQEAREAELKALGGV